MNNSKNLLDLRKLEYRTAQIKNSEKASHFLSFQSCPVEAEIPSKTGMGQTLVQ